MGKEQYADVIINISARNVDRVFQYRIPENLKERVNPGVKVIVPFGKGDTQRDGTVVAVSDEPGIEPDKMKDITDVSDSSVAVSDQLLCLAWWMKERYGSTMNQALKTVLPVKSPVAPKQEKTIVRLVSSDEIARLADEAAKKNYKARARLFGALAENEELPYRLTSQQLGITSATLKPIIEKGIIEVRAENLDRNPVRARSTGSDDIKLNEEQRKAVDTVLSDYDNGIYDTYLLYGITGSGKTEVYMELIDHVIAKGRQVIVLIPEISLTYQTVMRFYRRFGNRVSIINSRLSAGERYDQSERARRGEIDIMIGPRSALFTPFSDLGLIIIDEEHEGAYKSETAPRYNARDVAAERAKMSNAALILGSATPSLETYYRAQNKEIKLLTLTKRAKEESSLAKVHVVDMRNEMAEGNRSIFSVKLKGLIEDRLERGQQIMLFMNRRGYANFVSCRSCGTALKCPHCDVSLTYHNDGRLKCHYCGFERPMPKICPNCGSPYIAPFGTGTQKLEESVKKTFPKARVLRMDADTTAKKGAHEAILEAFADGEADILIGTQMIVKGHDFPNVTLVGIMAADLSLYAPDFRSSERTFELLTQASGRAGRGEEAGDVVIQTYSPGHFAIMAAADQDYEEFYRQEILYRKVMSYPPIVGLLTITLSSRSEKDLDDAMKLLADGIVKEYSDTGCAVTGPVNASPYKLNDIYRKNLYIKNESYDILLKVMKYAQKQEKSRDVFKDVMALYDL